MSPANLEVLFSPAEFSALKPAQLKNTVCVVYDVLRATTSMTMALSEGATKIYPAREIAEAVAMHQKHPDALLAGERDGVRILAALTGGVDFHLGNSPREFVGNQVRGRELIMTTTNGTRALHACAGAKLILTGSILNLAATAAKIAQERPSQLLIVCAGTYEEAAFEDMWAAGALCDLVWSQFENAEIADSAQIVREVFKATPPERAWQLSRNARRLLASPDLQADVGFCWRRDAVPVLGALRDGVVTRLNP